MCYSSSAFSQCKALANTLWLWQATGGKKKGGVEREPNIFLNPSPNTEHTSQNAKSKTVHVERRNMNSMHFFSGNQIVPYSQE